MEHTSFTADEVIEAWTSRRQGFSNNNTESVDYSIKMLRELAKGSPLSIGRVAELTGASLEEVERQFAEMANCGVEFNAAGELVGDALTLNPTPHRFHVNGKQLYAWCALDTLFLPGLLEARAEIESICPVTGQKICLTVTSDAITSVDPSDTVLSIIMPGVTSHCQPRKSA